MVSLSSVALAPFRLGFKIGLGLVQGLLFLWALYAAYDIRLYPITKFGMLIHEFDPWFNYRAAEYLCEHGLSKFFSWYDYMSWYPIGRPVGTTIYPGMQMTALAIRESMLRIPRFSLELPAWTAYIRNFIRTLSALKFRSLPTIPTTVAFAPMSVNDICCMMPCWFGSLASLFTGLLAYEVTRSANAAVVATGIMAIIPAHLMRSVGGEFDNECVAMAAIAATFWLWLRSIRTPSSWPWGVLTGISYIYMVLAWGGYIFVLNMIGLHALVLVMTGRFNSGVHKAYSLFFFIGTLGAMQIPVVGLQPVRSLEQLGPLLAFLGYQVLAYCDRMRRKQKMAAKEFVLYRIQVILGAGVLLLIVACALYPTGYFGPLSARIRGLFVKHTKTGNPLVDSVAEHRPASAGIYMNYLNLPLDYAWHGAAVCLVKQTQGCYFSAIYAAVAIHFSGKMSRLVLICAPICAVACAIWFGFLVDVALEPLLLILGKQGYKAPKEIADTTPTSGNGDSQSGKNGKKAKAGKAAVIKGKDAKETSKTKASKKKEELVLAEYEEEYRPGGMMAFKIAMKDHVYEAIPQAWKNQWHQGRAKLDSSSQALSVRIVLSAFIVMSVVGMSPKVNTFVQHCHSVANSLANPKVVFAAEVGGQPIIVDDYLKGYQWIDANTPKDARVIAWWDYGYQITGIANRTSLADGNTWNHEHIATLGRVLTSPEKKAWNSIRHLADYLLVWAGGGGDDLGKSPHLARIGNSVFPDHCGDDDPKCNKFGFYSDRTPTPMMAKSLLYKAVKHRIEKGVSLDPQYFQEVHTTKYGKMRIYKVMNVSEESKAWVADPKNRVCDHPGSWYCVGQYPPALEELIASRNNFAQVEDFNKGGSKSAYTKMIEKERGSEL